MIQAYSLFEGSFSVDITKRFIPFDPLKDDPKDRPASLFVHIHPFLIESNVGLILCDSGLGHRTDQDELLIHANIKKLGFDPNDVRYVLMSHLHKDHSGGIVDFKNGSGRIAFPEAEYVVQRGEWENAFSTNSSSYNTDVFDVLQRSGNLLLVEGSGQLNSQISYELNAGHTQFHQAFHIEVGGEHYFFGGDVLSEPKELFKNFIAKYDFDGRSARDSRIEYWKRGIAEDWVYLFYHSNSIAIGRPELKDDGAYKLADATI